MLCSLGNRRIVPPDNCLRTIAPGKCPSDYVFFYMNECEFVKTIFLENAVLRNGNGFLRNIIRNFEELQFIIK